VAVELSTEDMRKLEQIRKKAEAAIKEQGADVKPLLAGSLMASSVYCQLVGQSQAMVEKDLTSRGLGGHLVEGNWYVDLGELPDPMWRIMEDTFEREIKPRLDADDQLVAQVEQVIDEHKKRQRFVMVTTPIIPARPVAYPLGVVSGDAVVGLGQLTEVLHGLAETTAGRSPALTRHMRAARATCLEVMREQALEMGAEAIVGVSFSTTEYNIKGTGMLVMSATGTAVVCKS